MSGGGSTSTQSNAPPKEYLDAYTQVMQRANNAASVPYQGYTGQLQAAFSPQQYQGFDLIGTTPTLSAPYINAASDAFYQSQQPLQPAMQPYTDASYGQYANAARSADSLQSSISPWQAAAAQGFQQSGAQVNPQQYTSELVNGYMSPYIQNVVDATQAQFNNQNAQAQNQLRGNAASQGALGGDRLGVAQGVLAGQQQLAQAPTIANLYNQGFGQAQQELNNQQQTLLSAQQANRAAQMQGAQGFASLGNQALQAAQGQGQMSLAAGQGIAGLGQQQLGAAQSQGWLNAQSGAGFAGLGNQALGSTLQSANALLGAGAQQQAQAQGTLNIPYQQFLAAQGYPYQQIGWLSNIAQGLGSASGGTQTSTGAAPNPYSQLAGAGIGAAGLVGATGGYGKNGWLTNAFNGSGSSNGWVQDPYTPNGAGGGFTDEAATLADAAGGRIQARASGGEVPDVSVGAFGSPSNTPGQGFGFMGAGVPDAGISVLPDATGSGATPHIKQNYGTTTKSDPGFGGSTFGQLLKAAASVAGSVYGGPAGGIAAGALVGGLENANRGGGIRRADGGPISTHGDLTASGFAVPHMTVNPNAVLGATSGLAGGSSGVSDYLKGQAAGVSLAPPKGYVPPPPPSDAQGMEEKPWWGLSQPDTYSGAGGGGEGGGGKRGGFIRPGFAIGGAPLDADSMFPDLPPSDDAPVDAPAPADAAPPLSPDDSVVPPIPPSARRSNAPRILSGAPAGPMPEPPDPPDNDRLSYSASGSGGFGGTDTRRPAPTGHADPWLALMNAGFGTMAGRSPYALSNVGAGVQNAVEKFTTAEQHAQELAVRVDEARARQAEAASWHQSTDTTRNRAIDQRAQQAKDRMDQTMQLAMIRAAGNRGTTGAEAEMENVRLLMMPGPNGEPGLSRPDAIEAAKGFAGRSARGDRALDIRSQRSDAIDAFNSWKMAHGDASQAELAGWHAFMRQRGVTDQDLRMYGANKDVMGKPTMTPEQAHNATDELRNFNAPAAPRLPAAPRDGAPAVGTVMQGYRYNGGDPASRDSWAPVQ